MDTLTPLTSFNNLPSEVQLIILNKAGVMSALGSEDGKMLRLTCPTTRDLIDGHVTALLIFLRTYKT